MKKMKTGDVKRLIAKECWNLDSECSWVLIGPGFEPEAFNNRNAARFHKYRSDRIARILSIGPKYVTVRISK